MAASATPAPLHAPTILAEFTAHRAGGASSRAPLLTLAASCFDADALSRSFLLPQAAAQPCAQKLSLDVETASGLFGALEGLRGGGMGGLHGAPLGDAAADSALKSALSASLLRAGHSAKGAAGAGGALRVGLLLLCCCSSLGDPGWGPQLRSLLELLAALPAAHAALAKDWLASSLATPAFRRALQTVQSHVLAVFFAQFDPYSPGAHPGQGHPPQLVKALAGPLAVLGWLHAANEKRASGAGLDQAEFHCDALNAPDWIDGGGPHGASHLASDFVAWEARGGGRAAGPLAGSSFSFCFYPFLYSPGTKARILGLECMSRQREAFSGAIYRAALLADNSACPYCILKVRRDHLVEDAARELGQRHADLYKPLKVIFVGEEGVDEGGPTREFFTLLTRTLFTPDYGMFKPQGLVEHRGEGEEDATSARMLWFAPGGCEAAGEAELELAGTVLGLAIYNGTLLELSFPRLVYKLLLGGTPAFEDLQQVSPELHTQLRSLLQPAPGAASADTLGLTFEVSYQTLGAMRTAELVPGGADLALTAANAREYVAHYADWVLSRSVRREFAAFRRGFAKLLTGPAVRLFRPDELEQLLCGCEVLDFAALQAHCTYGDGTPEELAHSFWRVAHALEGGAKKRLLAFVTGSDRVPIGGLAQLPFKLTRNGDGDERLPTAHTCFNTLMLPHYSTDQVLRERLLLALENSEGFGLR